MNPQLFCKTVLTKITTITSYVDTSKVAYYKSLVKEMSVMKPMGLLKPDSLCYVSAKCHAVSSGERGYTGHGRTAECQKTDHARGECCQYGLTDPLGIIVVLLVDQDIESLGHRNTCLGSRYTKMSPAMAPHKKYGNNTVMDFYR